MKNTLLIFSLFFCIYTYAQEKNPTLFQCPFISSLKQDEKGSWASVNAKNTMNGITISWSGYLNRSGQTLVRLNTFINTMLDCGSGELYCRIECRYSTKGDKGMVIISPSLSSKKYYKAINGGYGSNWDDNFCMSNNTSDCQFEILEKYPF